MQTPTKPHIVFCEGYWRVSPAPIRCTQDVYILYVKAHNFTTKLNGRILIGQRTQYRNRHKENAQ